VVRHKYPVMPWRDTFKLGSKFSFRAFVPFAWNA